MRCRWTRDTALPYLTLVELPLGKVLYESGGPLRHVYFPVDAIVSLLYVLDDGASAEIAVVGNDGVLASPCSWAVRPRRTGLLCRAAVGRTG